MEVDNVLDPLAAVGAVGMVAGMPYLRKAIKNRKVHTVDDPAERPMIGSEKKLKAAAQERIREFDKDYDIEKQSVTVPEHVGRRMGLGPSAKAGNLKVTPDIKEKLKSKGVLGLDGKENIISINPFSPDVVYAHELGHTISQRTKIGGLLQQAKQVLRGNQDVTNIATLLAPAIGSALMPGGSDMATALGLAYAINAPTLLDEAFATGEGFGIMKRAGSPATLADKRRMAGSYLSYLMTPTALAVGGNVLGKMVGEEFKEDN